MPGRKVRGIVVKDLSRLGRNYVEVWNLLKQVFPFQRVRVISMNDGYDNAMLDGQTGGWNTSVVAKVIRDGRYVGHMVSGKKAYESFDSRRQVGVDRSDWIVVRDTHEGIVTQEEFDRANANMWSVVQGKKRESANKGNYSVIVSPHCGLTLRPGTQKESILYCPTGQMHRGSPCSRVRRFRSICIWRGMISGRWLL